jgi:hypothetical protein
LVTLLAGGVARRSHAITLGVVGGLCFLLPGVVPIGSFPNPTAAMALSLLTTVALLGMNGWVLLRPQLAEASETEPEDVRNEGAILPAGVIGEAARA